MHPILFQFKGVVVYTYGFFIALGFLVGITLAGYEGKRVGENPEKIMDLSFYLLVSAIVGSRLFYVVTRPDIFFSNPLEILKIWNGGLVFYGAFIFAAITAIVYLKKNKMALWKITDILAPSLVLAQVFGRIGCFFAGCCYGKECNLPWAVTFTNPNSLAPTNIMLHPSQLYHALGNLIIFGVLWLIRKRKGFDGQVFWIYVLLYGLIRAFLEIFRGDYRGQEVLGTFSISQAIGLSMAGLAVCMIIFLGRREPKVSGNKASL